MRAARASLPCASRRPGMKRRQSGGATSALAQRRLADTKSRFVACPVCDAQVPKHDINAHVERCLGSSRDPADARGRASPAGPSSREATGGGSSAERTNLSLDRDRPSALAKLKPSTGGVVCRARLGKGKPWHPMTLEEVHKRFPLFLSERALPAEDADALLRELLVEGQTWTQDEWWIAGEARKAPRLTAVYEMTPGGGEAGVADGEENESLFENALRAPSDLMRAAARAAGEAATTGVKRSSQRSSRALANDTRDLEPKRFRWSPTYAVANLYRDGSDRVGAHADRLTSLGPDAVIAGVSLGRARVFRLKTRWPRNPDGSDDCAVDVPLPHNSVCVMLPGCQELWTHEILRDGAAGGGAGAGERASRVSLTFRKKEDAWDASAPSCLCGRRCVLKTRRADAGVPAFARTTGDVTGDGEIPDPPGATRVQYYYTCDSVNGGKPCAFFKPVETRLVRQTP